MKKTIIQGTIIMLLVLLVLSTGCTRILRASKRLDMGPFGENTTTMVNDIQHNLVVKKPLYIKPYLQQGADFTEFQRHRADMQTLLRDIVLYSTQVVSLSRSNLTGQEKAKALAQYIEKLMVPLTGYKDPGIHFTRAELDTGLGSVRSQQTLLAALGAAQPFVDTAVTFSNNTFEKLNELSQWITQETQERIDSNSAMTLENAASLKKLQELSIKSYSLLYDHRMGNPKALDALLKNDPVLRQYVKKESSIDARLDLMEKALISRLQNISAMAEQIRPQLDQYRAETRELDDFARANDDIIRKARVTVQIWARSHGNLAAGIDVPPAIDMADIFAGAATTAAKKALTIH